MAWSGAAYAFYGIFSLLLEPTMILWREKTAYVGSLTATFINRNTAATYFGSCAAVWLILLMEAVRGRLSRGPIAWASVHRYLLAYLPKGIAVPFAMFFVCLSALFMTGSRGGVIVSLLVFVLAFVLFFRRDLPRGKGLIVTVLAAGATALLLLQFLGSNIGYRIDVHGLSDPGRLEAYRSALRIIAEHPWFGTGLGTFAVAFPAYRSGNISMQGVWDSAHSTPLEFAAELGLPLTALVLSGWLIGMVVLLRATRRHRRAALIPLAAFSVIMIGSLHSLFDFSLQVTGYAIVAFALLGIGLAQSLNAPNDDTPGIRSRRERQSDPDLIAGSPRSMSSRRRKTSRCRHR
jgi:O-antigen ligase